jgi:hypothetical protein
MDARAVVERQCDTLGVISRAAEQQSLSRATGASSFVDDKAAVEAEDAARGFQGGEDASAVQKVAEESTHPLGRGCATQHINISLLGEFLSTVSPSCSCSRLPFCHLRCTPSSSRRNP